MGVDEVLAIDLLPVRAAATPRIGFRSILETAETWACGDPANLSAGFRMAVPSPPTREQPDSRGRVVMSEKAGTRLAYRPDGGGDLAKVYSPFWTGR